METVRAQEGLSTEGRAGVGIERQAAGKWCLLAPKGEAGTCHRLGLKPGSPWAWMLGVLFSLNSGSWTQAWCHPNSLLPQQPRAPWRGGLC